MKIEELNLQAFGKFKNKQIELKDGINLIYGENESGKSTIFKFIEGIFYGFAKSGVQRRTTSDFEKYRPWTGSEYKGSIVLNNGDSFRIMRNFDKYELDFHNMTTGENLSSASELNKFAKIKQPGVYLFDVESSVFSNSFFIGQLESKLGSEVDTLKHSLENFVTSGDEKYSLIDAVENLEKKSDELGRESRKTSPIGKLYQQIELLKKKKSELKLNLSRYEEITSEFLELKQSLYEQRKFVRNLKLSDDQRNYQKIKKFRNSKENLGKVISDTDYETLIEIDREYSKIESRLNEERNCIDVVCEYDDIEKDYIEFKKLCNRIDELNRNNFSKEIELLNHDLIISKTEVNKLNGYMLIALGLALLSILGAIYFRRFYIGLVAIPLLFFAYLKFNPYRMKKAAMDRIEDRISDYMKQSAVKTQEKREMDNVFSVYMRKYRLNSLKELREFFEDEISKLNKMEIEKDVRNEIEENIRIDLEKKLETFKLKIAELERKYDLSFDELREKYLSDEGKSLIQDIKNSESIIEHILNGRDIEDLNHNIEVVDGNLFEEESVLEELEAEFIELSGKMSINDDNFHRLTEVDEELSILENKLKELEDDQRAIHRAIDVLKEIYSQNKEVFLPKVVEFMNEFIKDITSGKYDRIVVDEKFNIVVEDKASGKMVEVEKLSNGTVDQLYLGIRLAISEIMYKNAPVVLDDHFIQYDDLRCRETLKFLNNYSNKKQIIIFSAMNREAKILDEMGIEYNKVNL
ncbi:ATP-binding protein [Peptoniphilus indolicus]|uniref:Chromosome segregation protein n=1 Tax=Peptoniphilus indolicus TaxID=33030 RepID=A0A379DBU9_9FIRM|nr:AAA family ATPase [Peptoniphilus indolicus]SUB74723.1 chromosome segregation protein [Peptoniphilus indolicus]